MTTAALFPAQARKQFIRITGQRYGAMVYRLRNKPIPVAVPFSREEFRAHVLNTFMGGEYDGAIQCRWCLRIITLEECAFDHLVPLDRFGSPDLGNLDAPCAKCNAQKGIRTPQEWKKFLAFLEQELPFARVGLLKQLQEHSALLAGKRRAEALARSNGQIPPKKKRSKPPLVAAIDDAF